MSLGSFFGNNAISFGIYRMKNARVSAILMDPIRSIEKVGYSVIGDYAVARQEVPEGIYFGRDAMVPYWKVTTGGRLVLKNNSSNIAFNMQFPNAKDIFSKFDVSRAFPSLAGNQTMEIDIEFVQHLRSSDPAEAERLPDIPTHIQNRILIIEYENDGLTKMRTKFRVAFGEPYYKYSW